MTQGLALSTDGLRGEEAAQAWRDWMADLFVGLDSDVYGDADFEGHVRVEHAGDVVLTRLEAGRHRVVRNVHSLRRPDADYLKIVAPWQGVAAVQQGERRASARNGCWVIYDTAQPYEVANPEWSEHLIVMLPKHKIAERGLRLEGLMGRNVGGSSGMARIALETMRSTYQELPGMAPSVAVRAGDLLLDMVHLALQELAGQSSALSQQQAFQDRIRAYVMAHLRSPSLSVQSVAQALNCSTRHLHNAFAAEASSLGAWIQHSRLELCMRELGQPQLRAQSIADVAYGCGFGSAAHFSRIFKAYTGLSPSEFRAIRLDRASVAVG